MSIHQVVNGSKLVLHDWAASHCCSSSQVDNRSSAMDQANIGTLKIKIQFLKIIIKSHFHQKSQSL